MARQFAQAVYRAFFVDDQDISSPDTVLEIAAKLGVDRNKVIVTVDRHGNTSAASVPLALDEAVRDGRIQRGQKVLLEGVGGGFTWGAALLEF